MQRRQRHPSKGLARMASLCLLLAVQLPLAVQAQVPAPASAHPLKHATASTPFVRVSTTSPSATQPVGDPSARVAKPVIEPARGGQCVEDPATMRRNHMEYLKHQRDDTVHGGVRGAKYSLKACIECHASPRSQSVVAKSTNFCVSCHSFAAVRIDCFECHSAQPKQSLSFPHLLPPTQDMGSLQRTLQLRQWIPQVAKQP